MNVLIADDDRTMRFIMRQILWRDFGATVVEAADGLAALKAMASDEFDLVVLDLHMPEVDGLAALERIRAGEAGPRAQNIWVAALTADVRQEQKARAFAAGANDFLTKPMHLPELEAAFRRYRAARLSS